MPEELPPVPSFVDQWTPSGKYAKADTALRVVINPGDTTISNASISLTLNGEAVATDIASADGILTVTASGVAALASGVKYDLALTYTDSAVGEQTQTRKFEVPVYFEDFDSVELGPNVDELAVDNEVCLDSDRPGRVDGGSPPECRATVRIMWDTSRTRTRTVSRTTMVSPSGPGGVLQTTTGGCR